MNISASIIIALMPSMAVAATDCRIIEYTDHVEAICTGDATAPPPQLGNGPERQAAGDYATAGGVTSRRAQRMEKIQALSVQRRTDIVAATADAVAAAAR